MSVGQRYARLPTAAKLLLILTAVLLPIGAGLAVIGEGGIREANRVLDARDEDQSRAVAQAIESLIARNALALRIAANGALAAGSGDGACNRARGSLAISPAVAQSFELETGDGKPICAVGDIGDTGTLPHIAPGDIRARIAPDSIGVAVRVGVNNGMATSVVGLDELKKATSGAGAGIATLLLQDEMRELRVFGPPPQGLRLRFTQWPISNGNLSARIGVERKQVTTLDRLLLLLPLLMWIAAAMVTWLLVSRLLVRPLKRLERAVSDYRPADGSLDLPRRLGPSREIQELRNAFGRAISRVEESERETTGALEGQRRLVREVHHRVKNNLQVVASLLNIHGRSAETPDARAAYASISRRVGALSIVHRNHFAEMEENRGLALRPLLTELGAELRASAPEMARRVAIDLDLEAVNTTQDVAVAVAFLITEIVEFAMLNEPEATVEISLRRTSELTARLAISSPVLVPDDQEIPEKAQFERIVGGLAKQLRSSLDRKLGRYSVDLPVFPPA
jgi:two-component sensor histidine kinase